MHSLLHRSHTVLAAVLTASIAFCAATSAFAAGGHGGGGFGGGMRGGAPHGGAWRGGFHGGVAGGWRGYGLRAYDRDHDHDRLGRFGYSRWGGYGGWGWDGPWLGYDLFLPTLPLYYSTLWWDGVPYYYADDNYYVWNGSADEYQAVDPPSQVLNQTSAGGVTQLYAYPRNGQDFT